MIRTPSRFRVRTVAVAFALLALSGAALAWPTETVLNIAGGVLMAAQVLAVAVVIDSAARERAICGMFLLVSGVLAYRDYLISPDDWKPNLSFESHFDYGEQHFTPHGPIASAWQSLFLRLTGADEFGNLLPNGPLPRLANPDYHFQQMGLVLTAMLLAVLSAAIVAAMWRTRTEREKRSRPELQFSLRALLSCMLLIALTVGGLVRERQRCLAIKQMWEPLRASVSASGNNIGWQPQPGLFPWFDHNVRFDVPLRVLSFNPGLGNSKRADLERVVAMPEVVHVSLDQCEALTEADLLLLHRAHGLRSVSLYGFDGTALDKLTGIDLAEISMVGGSVSIEQLHPFPNLRSLYLNMELKDSKEESLWFFTRLEYLSVDTVQVTNASAPWLGSLRHMKDLNLSQSAIDDGVMKHLSKLTELQVLILPPSVTERGVAELRELRQLKRFHSSGVSDDLVPWLCQNTKLWTLDLSGSPLTDKGFAELQSLPELQYLHVNGTRISDNSLELALRSFSSLNMLSVNNTQTTEAGRDRFYAKRKFPMGGF